MTSSYYGYRVRSFPGQAQFYNAEEKYSGFSGPVGTGKTMALCCRALIEATNNPGRRGLIGAPTYPMLRDVTIRTMLELLDERGTPFDYMRGQHLLYLKRCRAEIVFRSLENYERLRGANLAWFGVDELTYCHEQAWQRLEARLRDPLANHLCAFAVWTPKGYDWVYRRFIGPDRLPQCRAVLAGPNENVAILKKNPRFYEDLKASYDDRFYQQEALGAYLDVYAGRVYHGYSRERNDKEQLYNPHEGIAWGIDFNVDPMATVLAQTIHGKVHVLEELMLPVATTITMCERVLERIQPWLAAWQNQHGSAVQLPLYLYGDAAGNSRSTKASQTDYDLIREFFRRQLNIKLYPRVPSANPAVKDRVNSVNALLCDATGRVRVEIDPRCKSLQRDLIEVTWKQGSSGFEIDKKKDTKLSHISDALGYLIWEYAPVDAFKRANIYP